MLVIKNTEYFNAVLSFAEQNALVEIFNRDMLALHLWGCSWVDQANARVVLTKGANPLSFEAVAYFRNAAGTYDEFISAAVEFEGPRDLAALSRSERFKISLTDKVGWHLQA